MSTRGPILEISSPANALFKSWKSLLTSKGIRGEGLFLLSGEKLIRELAREGRHEILVEIIGPRGEPITQAPKVARLSSELFRELDEVGTHHSLAVLKLPEIPRWNPTSAARGLEIFCPVGDPLNLGAILRSAEAFGASRVILLEEAANPFLPKAIKASAGSSLRVTMEKGPSLSALSGEFIALDLEGTSLPDFKWPPNPRLLVGEEGPGLRGLSSAVCLQKISIPVQAVESLNAGVATSIALYSFTQTARA